MQAEALAGYGRRRFLYTGAALGVAAAAVALFRGCGKEHAPLPGRATAYLPLWLTAEAYQDIGDRLQSVAHGIARVHLAFATFDDQAQFEPSPVFEPSPEATAIARLLRDLSPATDLSVAVGGANIREAAWRAALRQPSFGAQVEAQRDRLEQFFQRPVHTDLDCEADLSTQEITRLARLLRDAAPVERELTMAVPAARHLERFDADKLCEAVRTFRVMTYDKEGPWGKHAGPIVTGEWVVKSVAVWAQKIGDARRLEAGYPAYGYVYKGAQKAGDLFTPPVVPSGAIVPYADLPVGTISDDLSSLTSETYLDGNWVSCASPRVIGATAARLAQQHPDLGGSFFWAMDGLTAEHVCAVMHR